MKVINEFLEQYSRQYDYYAELAKIGSGLLEQELEKRGLKAIVSYRAKRPERLKSKLNQRNTKTPYKSVKDIFTDIVDLAGVRVALYFPKDRDLVNEIIYELFNVNEQKEFPEKSHQPKHEKRFSGYWATHYRVNVKNLQKSRRRYENALFEIQVASVLMHAWSEVEHDLVYKPLSGDLSEEELSILDEINGLVLTGEIALERLQKAITKRSRESNDISSRYELTSLITNSLNKNYIKKLKLGDTKLLFNYLKNEHGLNTAQFVSYINRVNQSENETIAEQLLSMILADTYSNDDDKLRNYLGYFIGDAQDISGFESFVKTWIVLEKAVSVIHKEQNKHHKKYFTAKFGLLAEQSIISHGEAIELNNFKRIRNNLLHGIETPLDYELREGYLRLHELTYKVIMAIEDKKTRDSLSTELQLLKQDNN